MMESDNKRTQPKRGTENPFLQDTSLEGAAEVSHLHELCLYNSDNFCNIKVVSAHLVKAYEEKHRYRSTQ